MTRSRDVSAVQNNLGVAIPPAAAGKNTVINGGFDIWQRGTSVAGSSSTTNYTTDRWCGYTATAATTISRQATSDTTNLPNIQYCARTQRTAGNTGTGVIYFAQSIESANSIPFAGKTITFSFYARAGANYSATSNAISVYVGYGTGTDQNILNGLTGQTVIVAPTATLTTTWQRFTYTGTVGTNATQLAVYFGYTPTGTAGANDYFEITGVQLELGSSATPFSRAGGTIQGELAACQRYYQRINNPNGNTAYSFTGIAGSTTRCWWNYPAPVSFRANPSISQSAAKIGNTVITNQSITSITFYSAASTNGISVDTSVGSGLIASNAIMLVLDTNAYVEFNAEL